MHKGRKLELAQPFPTMRGEGVRIAVIDSGVHTSHEHIISTQLLPGITISPEGALEAGEHAALDRLGHGTAVTAAIQEKAPGANIIPVQVFNRELKTTGVAIVSAIRWSIDQGARVINLSLGSGNPAHRDAFERAVAEAIDANVTIVAASRNGDQACYPGALDGVVGVELDWECPRTQYRAMSANASSIFLASGYPRPIPRVPMRRNLTGISFAVAQLTGFTALACAYLVQHNERLTVDNVKKALFANAPGSNAA